MRPGGSPGGASCSSAGIKTWRWLTPSGHTTLMVVVLGMVMLVFGAHRWLVAVAIVFASLGMLGQAVTYHYFTDTVGGLLLGTSLTLPDRAFDRCQA